MSDDRTSHTPVPHLVAEVAAIPLVSEASFRYVVTGLDPELTPPTDGFWRAAENDLLRGFPSTSLDEIVNLRDLLWFPNPSDPSLAAYLQALSSWFLRDEGARARPALPLGVLPRHVLTEASARWMWRWISLSMPPDLLLAAVSNPTASRVTAISPTVEQFLCDGGFAELHLHLGAATDFPDQWVLCLLALAHPNGPVDSFRSAGAAFDEGALLRPWLVRAALMRSVLADFLFRRPAPPPDFATYLNRLRSSKLAVSESAFVLDVARDFARGESASLVRDHARCRALFARISGVTRRAHLTDASDPVQDLDPIRPFLPSSHNATPEVLFVRCSLDYLRANPDDRWFSRVFWQVVRLRCIYYRYLVQRPLTRGLQYFFRHYDRLKTGKPDAALKSILAMRVEGAGSGLASLEVRTAPDASLSETLRDLRVTPAVRNAAQKKSSPLGPVELGMVLHFVRERGGGAKEGRPKSLWRGTHADPSQNQGHMRHANYYRATRQQALAIAKALCWFPLSATFLRGLDTCTDELGTPTWVLAPLFRFVRDAGRNASRLIRARLGMDVPALRFSAHTGEDWVHLLGALRRVDDTVRFFELREGDRLGHALALGTDPQAWAESVGHVTQAREERLLDLAWEWSFVAQHPACEPGPGRLAFGEREVARLSEQIFKETFSPQTVATLWADLHKESALAVAGFPNGRRHGRPALDPQRARLVDRMLRDVEVFRGGRELEWIDAQSDVHALRTVQRVLVEEVARLGLCVEVNPCSNLLIGNLSDMCRHPVWRLAPPEPQVKACFPAVCICSDDPAVFATTLREEYQQTCDALLRAGFSEPVAMSWLDRAREHGMRARFTLPLDQLRDPYDFVASSALPPLPP